MEVYRADDAWDMGDEEGEPPGVVALGIASPPAPPLSLGLQLPMTLPTRADPSPSPKDAYVWVPAILAHIGLQTQQDMELARRTGMTMRLNEQHALEFNFTGVNDAQGQYLCRYVRAVCRRLGMRGVKLSDWNAMVRNLRDAKSWTVAGSKLHNIRLFREAHRGGRPLSSGGQCYQERQRADDPSYYQPWEGAGGSRPTPKVRGAEEPKDVDSGKGGLPGATMELAALLAHHLEHGCTWHGVAVPPNPRLFEAARRDADFLDTDDAMTLARYWWKNAKVPNLGSLKPVPEKYEEAVKELKKAGDQLVNAGEFAEAAAKYQEAYTFHPSSKTLPKMIQRAEKAAASVDVVEAQLNAHGGQISWDQFVYYWMASADRSNPMALPITQPMWVEDIHMPELSSADIAHLPVLEDQWQDVVDEKAPRAEAAATATLSLPPPAVAGAGHEQEQEQEDDLVQTLSNSMDKASIDPPPRRPSGECSASRYTVAAVVEWVVDIDQGWPRGWNECELQIVTDTATMTLREKGAGGCSGRVIAEKQLPGCRVTELRNPRNRHGKCNRDRSARKIEFEDGDSYKLVPVSRVGHVWYPGRVAEAFEVIERFAQWVPPLLGGTRSRSSRGSRRESHGRSASPPRRLSYNELERCRSDRSHRSSDSSARGVPPPPLRRSLDGDLFSGGWLWKAGQYNKAFKKRFCRLECERGRRVLKYYEGEPREGMHAKGEIDLDKAVAESSQPILAADDTDPQQFKLRAEGREYRFKWDNECGGWAQSAQAWISGLLSATRRASQRLSDSLSAWRSEDDMDGGATQAMSLDATEPRLIETDNGDDDVTAVAGRWGAKAVRGPATVTPLGFPEVTCSGLCGRPLEWAEGAK